MTEQTGDARVTRLVRSRTLVVGAVFKDPVAAVRGECTVLDVEVHDDVVSALVLTESGYQAAFERNGWLFVELVVS